MEMDEERNLDVLRYLIAAEVISIARVPELTFADRLNRVHGRLSYYRARITTGVEHGLTSAAARPRVQEDAAGP